MLKSRVILIQNKPFARFFLALIIAVMFVNSVFAQSADNAIEERKVLESELEKYEKQIEEYESTISNLKKQGTTLKSEIDKLNAKILKLNLQIKAINLNIKKIDAEISITQSKINGTEKDIDFNKEALSATIRNMYESENKNAIEILLENKNLSDFFNNLNNLILIQDSLKSVLQKITELKDKLVDEKETLSLEKADAEELKRYQDTQKTGVQKTQSEKNNILKITKGKESEYQKVLVETKKTAAEIRNRIFRMLGGGELNFGEAVKIAQVAENATGVRAAFILAVLTQESAIKGMIGANLGRCYYSTPRNNGSGTVMSNSQKPAFLEIMRELNMNPETTPVSCPIASDGAYGGAMGPAQFMPTTWELYKKRIGEITGGNPASPFNNLDAFTATALYLKDGTVSCRQIYNSLFSQENCAAAKYYAGKNYKSYMGVGRYGYRVADRAVKFQDDIDVLSG